MSKIHEVKTLPVWFGLAWDGRKPFEVRCNDRDYQEGEILRQMEWTPSRGYTGRTLEWEIAYVLDDSRYCKEGFVVLGLRRLTQGGQPEMLPCKPGDTVYFPVVGRWDSAVVDHIEVYPHGRVDVHLVQYDVGPDSEKILDRGVFGADQIGKTVFLSRQEAEAAIERVKESKMTCRGFEQVCTADEARDYFKAKGLTYGDITEDDILVLTILLQREFKKSNKAKETSVDMTISKNTDVKWADDGTLISCFFHMSAHYFTDREAISFNRDGFIGFAGWADVGNRNPLLRAFLAWCDFLTGEKSVEWMRGVDGT